MNTTETVSVASAVISLFAATVTLYLGRKSQSLQVDLKRLEADLREAKERRERATALVQALQRYRLELYQLRALGRATEDPALIKHRCEGQRERIQSAYDKLLEAWATIRIDLTGEAASNLAAGFHDDRVVYHAIAMGLEMLTLNDDEEKIQQTWEMIQAAVPQALQTLDTLEALSRGSLTTL